MARRPEAQISLERMRKWLGTVEIKLSQLTRFDDNQPALQPNEYRVDVLAKKFRRSHIQDGLHENYVKAVVSTQGLDRALRAKGLSREALQQFRDPTNYLELDFQDGELICLGGRSRVLASRKIPPWDRRWPVELYSEDISLELQKQLRDNYVVQAPLTDGEIFLTLQQYKQAGDLYSVSIWEAYLSETKANNIARLAETQFGIILLSLSLIPGLWRDGIHLGVLHKMRSLHVNSEIIHYLTEIKNFFGGLVGHDTTMMAKLTQEDIDALQSTAPKTSENDKQTLLAAKILGAFSPGEQGEICNNFCDRKLLIPTLFTFFHDISIINQCAPRILKLIDKDKLVPPNGSKEPDIRASMAYMFESDGSIQYSDDFDIQISESDSRSVTVNSHLRFELAYRQLWLYAIRHFLRPDQRKHRKIRFHIDQDGETRMLAAFASKLRFSSTSIRNLTSGPVSSTTRIVTDPNSGTRYASREQRCGLPHPSNWQRDRELLFLDRIYSSPEDTDITSFFVLQSIFYNFFGCPDGFTPLDGTAGNTNTPGWPGTSGHETTPNNQGSGQGSVNTGQPTSSRNVPGQPPTSIPGQGFPGHTDPGQGFGNSGPDFTSFRNGWQGYAPANPVNGVHSSSSSNDPTSVALDQSTINRIDAILERLSRLRTQVEATQGDMRRHIDQVTVYKGLLRETDVSFQSRRDSLLSQLNGLELSLNTRLRGVEDSHKFCLDLPQELNKIKAELLKPTTNLRLTATNYLYAQFVDMALPRLNYYDSQVQGDIFSEQEASTGLRQCGVAVLNLKVFTLYGSVAGDIERSKMQSQRLFQIAGHVMEVKKVVRSDQEISEWIARLEALKKESDIMQSNLKEWHDAVVRFDATQKDPASTELYESTIILQDEWIKQFPMAYSNLRDLNEKTKSDIDRIQKMLIDELSTVLKSQLTDINDMKEQVTEEQALQQFNNELEVIYGDIKYLSIVEEEKPELGGCLDRTADRNNKIKHWRSDIRQILQENEDGMDTTASESLNSKGGQLGQWNRFLTGIQVHMECVVGTFGQDRAFEHRDPYISAFRAWKTAQEQAPNRVNYKLYSAARNAVKNMQHQAENVEHVIYDELSTLVRDAMQKLENMGQETLLRKKCEVLLHSIGERDRRVSDDIQRDASPLSSEARAIEQLDTEHRETLKAVQDVLENWANARRSKKRQFSEEPPRTSARQKAPVNVRFWVMLNEKCRPLEFVLEQRHLSELGRTFTEARFQIQQFRLMGASYMPAPINFSVSSHKDALGYFASQENPKELNKYGEFLASLTSYIKVIWDPSQADKAWKNANAKFDFDLRSKFREYESKLDEDELSL
ncbi:hypothetical protein BGW36DRAFT_362882 [Talaromyces proteolyticus]|uniref:Uncharacterized protein n=1 Tax=Talaromyces proteolyticus TaxID=1131652 RepID=A0AAD4KL96_9EURO|nr:uncharacterized protein BGW36DRAFT_362882 [Talaromyces proteolyticus]KAH8691851.1 hypothetical protein BGW36DRAFT_362882 [Talaromyces proteolyticus]